MANVRWLCCRGLGSVIPTTDRLGVEIQVIIVGVVGVLVPWPGGTIHKFLNDVPFVPDRIVYFAFIGIVMPRSYRYLPPRDISANYVTHSQILLPNKNPRALVPRVLLLPCLKLPVTSALMASWILFLNNLCSGSTLPHEKIPPAFKRFLSLAPSNSLRRSGLLD